MRLIRRRRFGRVFEFDRNGPPHSGTKEQQQAVRAEVEEYVEYQNPFDKVLFALDKDVNKLGRHFIPVSFAEMPGLRGQAYPSLILLNTNLEPYKIGWIFLHELGHVVGWRLLDPIDRSEYWANNFAWWVQNGMPLDYFVAERLDLVEEST